MENRHYDNASVLAGHPRIHSGIDLVQRFEASALFSGLVCGERAHRILCELTRRLAADRPADITDAYCRLYEMQQFLNSMDGPQAPLEIGLTELKTLFVRAVQTIQAPAAHHAVQQFQVVHR